MLRVCCLLSVVRGSLSVLMYVFVVLCSLFVVGCWLCVCLFACLCVRVIVYVFAMCLLFVVCCVLFVDCCLLLVVVRCLLCAVCCVLLVVLLFVALWYEVCGVMVAKWWFVVCCLLHVARVACLFVCGGRCLLLVVACFVFRCLLFVVR